MAVKVTAVPLQMEPDGLAVTFTEIGTDGFTVMLMILDVAGLPVTQQVTVVVTTQLTWSPLASEEVTNVELLEPAFKPLTFHWNIGFAPILTGVAVNVTEVPEQMIMALELMVTLAGVQLKTISGEARLPEALLPPLSI